MSPRSGIRSESDRDAQGSGHSRCYPLRWLLSTKHFMEKAITLGHGSQQAVDCMRSARKSRTSYSRLIAGVPRVPRVDSGGAHSRRLLKYRYMRRKASERQSRNRLILLVNLQHLHRNLHIFTSLENIHSDIKYLENQSNDLKFSGGRPPCGFESRPRHHDLLTDSLARERE
jgi:hypothetical protein